MKKAFIYLGMTLFLMGCSSGGSNGGNPTPDPLPTAATLVFPENNQECNQGTNVNASQSTVTFRWNAAQNTDSYDVVLKNLNTQYTVTRNASTNELDIIINKGTPYSWYVVSKSNSYTATAQSDTWKFYNAGDPVTSHPPFPADATSPTNGASFSGITSQTLTWQGSDIDNDIASYDIYMDTSSPPTTLQGNTAGTTLDVTVAAGNIYYWKIVTKDAAGNTSESEVFHFIVN